jgi:hypothetical protein
MKIILIPTYDLQEVKKNSLRQISRIIPRNETMRQQDLYKRGRNYPVTCLTYGKNRKEDFKDYFFCHGCDLLESAVENQNKRANRHQKKYMCTGGHSDLSQPTRKQTPVLSHARTRTKEKNEDKNNNDDVEEPAGDNEVRLPLRGSLYLLVVRALSRRSPEDIVLLVVRLLQPLRLPGRPAPAPAPAV